MTRIDFCIICLGISLILNVILTSRVRKDLVWLKEWVIRQQQDNVETFKEMAKTDRKIIELFKTLTGIKY